MNFQPSLRRFWIALSNRHNDIYKYFLILLTIVLIVIGMPRKLQFNYTYRKGKPWTYENLMAPFDFAINKSADELNHERAEVLKNVHSFYRFNDQVAVEKISSFKKEFDETPLLKKGIIDGWPDGKNNDEQRRASLLQTGESILTEIYEKGIILLNSENLSADGIINVVKHNISEERSFADFLTIQTAFDFIEQELSGNGVHHVSPEDKEFLLPLLENSLSQNVLYDAEATKNWTKELLDNISLSRGAVQNGEVIVLKGQVVDEDIIRKMESLRKEMKGQEYTGNARLLLLLGHFILVSLAMTMLILFLYRHRREIYSDNSRIMLLMLLILLITYLFLWARRIDLIDVYLVPVCILPIIVRAFYDSRTALFTHIVTLLIISFEAPGGFEFMFIQTAAGMVATFSLVNINRRSQFFVTTLLIFLSYTVAFIGVGFIHEANLLSLDWMELRWFAGNSLLTLFAFPLIFIFERTFGFLSDISLMELCDSNSPLLRELALKAPGTFQHSIQVANLAEAAIFKIGGNPLLARTGAMYHDVGKIDSPFYFIENLNTRANPHDDLPFEESARIIKEHVIRGIEKARKYKVPEQVIDFIRTHHGTTRLQYFYQSFLKNYPNKIPDEEQFRYPGPLPFSRETAVLMMADSVEASSRSLQHADEKSITDLIEKIVGSQIEQEQFFNCPITLKDIFDIKQIFKKLLLSIYHVRIEYPE
jgi:putative nucleotidyltransferase with HDIG domain